MNNLNLHYLGILSHESVFKALTTIVVPSESYTHDFNIFEFTPTDGTLIYLKNFHWKCFYKSFQFLILNFFEKKIKKIFHYLTKNKPITLTIIIMIGTRWNHTKNAFICQISTFWKWCVLNVKIFNHCEIFLFLGKFVPSF